MIDDSAVPTYVTRFRECRNYQYQLPAVVRQLGWRGASAEARGRPRQTGRLLLAHKPRYKYTLAVRPCAAQHGGGASSRLEPASDHSYGAHAPHTRI